MGNFIQGYNAASSGGSSPAAANNVKITGGAKGMSGPSMGGLINGMGGLMTNEGQQGAFDGFMSALSAPFTQMTNNLIHSGTQMMDSNPAMAQFGQVTGQPITPMAPQMEQVIQPPSQPVAPPPVSVVPQDNGWAGVKSDNDAINWALQKGDITQKEAEWLRRWQAEANDGNNWVDGSGGTKDWDYMSSDLTGQNKGIVDKFYKSVSGNWGDAAPAPAQASGGLLGNLKTPRVQQGLDNASNLLSGNWRDIKKYQRPDA